MGRTPVLFIAALSLAVSGLASEPGPYLVSSRLSREPADLWEYDLYLVDGARRHRLTRSKGPEGEAAFHAGTGQLAFNTVVDRSYRLLTSTLDMETPRVRGERFVNAGHASFDPQGRRIVYPADQGDGRYILVIENLETGDTERLATVPGQSLSPEWSPDGRSIVFISDDPGDGNGAEAVREAARILEPAPGTRRARTWLFRHDLATGRTARLTRGEAPDRDPAFSPDGKTVAFSRRLSDWESHILALDLASGRISPLVEHASLNFQPAFSRDGRGLYFTSSRAQGFKIWFLDLDTGRVTRLTDGSPSEQRACPVPPSRAPSALR